jgi:hypothetical protein
LSILYFGMLAVKLEQTYPDAVLDRLNWPWPKDDSYRVADASLEKFGYVLYLAQQSEATILHSAQLAQLVGRATEIGTFDIEINDGWIYFIQKDGLALTPEAMGSLFAIIELVDIFDKGQGRTDK